MQMGSPTTAPSSLVSPSLPLSPGSRVDGDDWHEMLGIEPGDELTLLDAEAQLSNPNYDADDSELDVTIIGLSNALTDEPAPAHCELTAPA